MQPESEPGITIPRPPHRRKRSRSRYLVWCRRNGRRNVKPLVRPPLSDEDGTDISLWQEVWNDYFYRLHPEAQEFIMQNRSDQQLTEDQGQTLLQDIQTSYAGKTSTRLMAKIYAIVSHVMSFGRAIDILAQAGPSPMLLVWGLVRLILEPSARSVECHEKILSMLQKLSNYLPLFERWRTLFPEASYSELSNTMRSTCLDFITFIIQAINFLRRNGFTNALRTLLVPSLQSDFVSIEDRIKFQAEQLSLQIHTAEFEASQRRHTAMQGLIESSPAFQPPQSPKSRLPFRFLQNCVQKHDFYGREIEIDLLRKHLFVGLVAQPDQNNAGANQRDPQQSGVKQASVVLHGLGGIGKSSVALEYLYREFHTYPVILWLYAEKKEKLDSQFVQMARLLGLCAEGGDADESRELVLHWITELDSNWLIVFDNADEVSIVTPYWPCSKHGSIIITSRNPYPAYVATRLQLYKFTVDQGAEFLLSLLDILNTSSDEDRSAALSITQRYDGLPLGLRQAAYFMNKKGCLPSAFLDIYNKEHESIEQMQIPGYTNTVADVWEMSLSTLSSDALDLLDMLPFLDPDVIPCSLFRDHGHNANFTSFLTDQMRYLNATGELQEQSLIDVSLNKESISLHRFFQEATLRRLKPLKDRFEQIFSAVAHMVNLAIPEDDYLSMKHLDAWEAVETYIGHADVLYARSSEGLPVPAVNSILDIFGKIAGYYQETGQYNSCEETLRKAMALGKVYEGCDKIIYSKLFYYHGRAAQESNQIEDAVRDFEIALDLVSTNVQHLDKLRNSTYLPILYENIGMSSTGAGMYDNAAKYLGKAIEMGKEPNSPVSCVMGDFLQCLGAAHLWKGDLNRAEQLLSKAILNRCGANNENRGGALYSLGNVYLRQGRFTEAMEMHQETLRLYRQDLGDEHHWVADTCHKVGSIYAIAEYEKHDLEKAEQLVRKSLKIWSSDKVAKNSISGPAATRSKWKLAQILFRMESRDEEAEKLFIEAYNSIKAYKGREISRDPSEEPFVDELVFYWNR